MATYKCYISKCLNVNLSLIVKLWVKFPYKIFRPLSTERCPHCTDNVLSISICLELFSIYILGKYTEARVWGNLAKHLENWKAWGFWVYCSVKLVFQCFRTEYEVDQCREPQEPEANGVAGFLDEFHPAKCIVIAHVSLPTIFFMRYYLKVQSFSLPVSLGILVLANTLAVFMHFFPVLLNFWNDRITTITKKNTFNDFK